MSDDLTVGGLTLCRNDDIGQLKWIRIGGVPPQGWEPVAKATFPLRMPVFAEKPKYEIKVDFND